jgi:hypothetical protein
MFAAGELDRAEWFAARAAADERIAAARRLLDNGRGGPLADLPSDRDALAAEWDRRSLEGRRAILAAVVDRVTVQPADRSKGGRFDPDRVVLDWRA